MTHITDGVNGRQTRGMAYDGLDRLTQVTSNMFGTASYGYDVLDNLANKNGQAYVFDYGNRLRSATGKAWYGYDGQGRRVLNCNTSPSACDYQQYAYDGKLYFHRDNRTAKYLYNVYLGNSLVAIRELPTATGATETVLYQHTDALGTPIAVTDANKALAQTSEYEPYGQLLNRALTDGPGFTGHVQDATTALTYMQQRYYDPQIGRFLSVDPVTAYSNPVGASTDTGTSIATRTGSKIPMVGNAQRRTERRVVRLTNLKTRRGTWSLEMRRWAVRFPSSLAEGAGSLEQKRP